MNNAITNKPKTTDRPKPQRRLYGQTGSVAGTEANNPNITIVLNMITSTALRNVSLRRSSNRRNQRLDTIGCRLQPAGEAIGCFSFADKDIGAHGQRGLLTGIQMTDEDHDDRVRTGRPQET